MKATPTHKSDTILVEHYLRRALKGGKRVDVSPFRFERKWAVYRTTLEIGSDKHGDIALEFNDDGSIDITYWSPDISPEAEDVVPARMTLR